MKCIILAAGYATRLYPLTENFPKPLLKVGEKTIIDHLTDDIAASNTVDEYIVVSNHRYYEHFANWAAGKALNIRVIDDGSISNETRLGAVRDIQFAIESLGLDDDLLIIAGDNVLDFSLNRFIDYTREMKNSCVMRYYEPSVERLKKCGVLTLDGERVIAMTEKPENPASHWCCPPFYFYTRADIPLVADCINDGFGVDAPGSLAAYVCTRRPLFAMEMPGHRFDVGNLESYQKINAEYKGITR